ncbi:carbohydrate ABC transporter permease [uncultured Cellulomonas sp.]|uniref:carbohydrate ABC transporter permease n=1 Tax=uncultured Cellulomonas sp. TaxID=189682 RepID=UPI00261A4903|nr:carbohydrate ABC transporter permease [uncultured Cellulomonas sp.]
MAELQTMGGTAAPQTTNTARRRQPRRQAQGGARVGSHLFLVALVLYFITPLWWLVVASTKTNSGLFTGSGGPLWFNSEFNLLQNLADLTRYQGGIYWTWLGNSFLYALTAGVGATLFAVLAGYGFAKYNFRGRNFSFALLLGSVMVPLTALVIPTFVLLAEFQLVDTRWAIILPSLLSPLGVYLIRVYAQDVVPSELLDAGRVDGAGELRLFVQVALPLLRPAIVTVLLLSVVATWNNFFLALAMVRSPNLLPVTVGLDSWQALSNAGAGGEQVWNLIVTGALVSILPLIIAFLSLQRYWQGGLSLGSLK